MRQIRLKKSVFLGTSTLPAGSVVEITDDRRARILVDLGVAEFLAPVASLDPHAQSAERATAPRASERAARR